ncbi:MAG: zinc ribbon domain-containing protein [Rhodothermales bacterium]
MNHPNWACPKCQNRGYDVGEFRATGGRLAKVFDVQNKKFSTVSCDRCGYTEIYKGRTSTLGNVFDLFTGG